MKRVLATVASFLLACSGLLGPRQEDLLVGTWKCAELKFDETQTLDDGTEMKMTIVMSDLEAQYLEHQASNTSFDIRMDIPGIPESAKWRGHMTGTWSIKNGKLCETTTDVVMNPDTDFARRIEQEMGKGIQDIFPAGMAYCDEILLLTETHLTTLDQEGMTTSCTR